MKNRGNIIFAIVSFLCVLVFVYPVHAITPPTFPSCLNPLGSLKASYQTGTHGVPGDSTTYTGRDAVYTLASGDLIQCLCPTNGVGVQTNWWKNPTVTQDEKKTLLLQGWNYIENGALWGLESVPYFAKNQAYSCRGETLAIGGGELLGFAATGSMTDDVALLATLLGITLVGVYAKKVVKGQAV